MKRRLFVVVALLVAVGVIAGVAGSAQAAPTQQQSVASRLIALERNARQLKARVARDEDVTMCGAALQFDVNVGLLNFDEALAGLQQSSFDPFNDNGACARLGINRTAARILSNARSPFGLLRFDLQLMAAVR